MAYVYPRAKRQTRDLLRRRSFFVRQRAQLITHIQNTNTQFNLPPLSKKLTYAANRSPDIAERFFYVTATEVRCSEDVADRFHLYRVFDFADSPRLSARFARARCQQMTTGLSY
jgi:hypothetical protein